MISICTAFETALLVVENSGKVFTAEIDAECKHSESVMVKLDELLNLANLDINDEKDFAVIVGVGSFTGLRIGIALLKGILANRTEYNLVPLESLEFMAHVYSKKAKGDFITAIDALSSKVFVQRFDKNANKLTEAALVHTSTLAYSDSPIVSLEDENVSENKVKLTAEELLEFSHKKLNCGKSIKVELLAPLYLRKPQAEENLKNS